MINNELLGSLIGLIRAIQGNEDLVTKDTNFLIMHALATNDLNLKDSIEKEKQRLVPDCYTCQVNCGRNSNYDIKNLYDLKPNILELKLEIISNLVSLAKKTYYNINEKIINLVHNSLFAIGMDDWEYEELNNLLEKIKSLN